MRVRPLSAELLDAAFRLMDLHFYCIICLIHTYCVVASLLIRRYAAYSDHSPADGAAIQSNLGFSILPKDTFDTQPVTEP